MRTQIALHRCSALYSLLLLIMDNIIYPHPVTVLCFIGLLLLDVYSGVQKSTKRGRKTTSRGLRESVDKTKSYFTLLLAVTILANATAIARADYFNWLNYSVNGLLLAFCYIEVKSILENLIKINTVDGKPNFFAKTILIPMHNALILKFKANDTNSAEKHTR